MANYLKGDSFRDLTHGPQVVKSAVLVPANTTSGLFTVSTGNVVVTSLYGELAVTTSSTATTLALGVAPTVGTAHTNAIATAVAITSLEKGTWVTPQVSSGKGGALVVGADGGAVLFKAAEFVVAPGTITWTTNATTNPDAAMNWYLTYVPLDNGAYVS